MPLSSLLTRHGDEQWLSGRVFARRRRLGAELLQFSHRPRHRRTGAAGPQARSAEGQAVVVAPASGTVARVSLLR